MTEYNRKSTFNNEIKNFDKKTGEISSLEDLPNEILYKIFNYLDGCETYYAFNNLNHRFEQLMKSLVFVLYMIPDNQLSKAHRILRLHKAQIIRIYLDMSLSITEFVSFDSSFDQLEELYLYNCHSDIFIPFLRNISCLPRLSWLSLDISDQSIDLTDIYRIILTLPTLKNCQLSTDGSKFSSLLPIATINQQLSTIERLDIKDHCSINECLSIISYIPELSHLVYINTKPTDCNIGINSSISPSKLTHLYIRVSGMKFDVLELFISKIPSKLKVLSLTNENEDVTYLDANRWKRFLLKYFPQLEDFYLRIYARLHHSFDYAKVNQFLSLFWIERRWIFEAKMEYTHMLYSIEPYKKRWYDVLLDGVIPYSSELTKSSQLTLTNTGSQRWENIKRILTVAQIYHLVFAEEKTSVGTLILVVNLLPELVSLKLHSLTYEEPDDLDNEHLDRCFSKKSSSKIEKVYIEKLEDMRDAALLTTLCPRMKCLRAMSLENNTAMRSFYY